MKQQDIIRVGLDRISIPKGYPPTEPDTVKQIADSFGRIGQRTPITIRREPGAGFMLVAGRNRLAAAKKLGWEKIECVEEKIQFDSNIWHVVENLHRKDLGAAERAKSQAAYVRYCQEKTDAEKAKEDFRPRPRAKIKKAKDGTTRGRPESGINKAARDLGIARETVREAVKIDSLPENVLAAARESGLDNRDALREIAKTPAKQQLAKVAELAQRNADRAERAAKVKEHGAPITNVLAQAWSHAARKTREDFVMSHWDDLKRIRDSFGN